MNEEGEPFRAMAAHCRLVAKEAVDVLLESDEDPDAWERVEYSEGQGGRPPRRIDRLLHRLWVDGLSNAVRPVTVFGEEADDASFESVDDGGYIAVVDPLDGTSNWASVGTGAAMSVVVYRKVQELLLYIGVSVFQIHWRRHWWAEPTATWRGSIDRPIDEDMLVLSSRPVANRDDWMVGGVAASAGPTRTLLNYLSDEGIVRTTTLGGVPLGPEILDRELVALVECRPTTVFDSAHLMLLTNTDAVVGTLDGKILGPPELRDIFLRVRLAKDRVVPPYIAAKAQQIYEILYDAWKTVGSPGGAN